jgi:mono/diheme cytochrome c family protein/glucose/arabinose dehydrogenase
MKSTRTLALFVLAAVILVASSAALLLAGPPGGDLAQQQPKYHIDHIPPAPVLSPQDELKTFKLPPGFKIELVAAEPMVEEPIALVFDPDGRIYIVELRAYMQDLPGTGELDPIGRIVRLDSSARDGRYDNATTFLDKLIIPRSIALAGDGVLVAEPPTVWFARDTNGDGVCDEKKAIFTDFGSRNPNPEHMANGLVWTLDNWYYNADWPTRFRYSPKSGQFIREGTTSRGQWGIAADDTGRLFFNSNSVMLMCDLVPSQYMTRNPYLASPAGLSHQIASNATFPSRVNPGVNRGYTEDLNLQGKLQRVTAACAPTVYRAGAAFPAEFYGNVFVCEPAGNLVSRQVISQQGLKVIAKSVQHDGLDFLTSTDERFRPVNIYTGPDGALYVVDMYHGIIQHKAYVSSYLADQIKKRNLEDRGQHHGRIWRITHESAKPTAMPSLSTAPSAELVKQLSNPNGWWRDTTQRLLVERQDMKAVPALKKLIATASEPPFAKIHALYTLQALDRLEDEDTAAAAKDADPRVRIAALRAGDVIIHKHTAPLTQMAAIELAKDPDEAVQFQVLVLGSPDLPDVQAAATGILARHLADPIFRVAALNAATGRELEAIQSVLAEKAFAGSFQTAAMLNDLAECVTRSRSADRIEKLLELIATRVTLDPKSAEAMLNGVVDALYPGGNNGRSRTPAPAPRHLRLTREPPSLRALLKNPDAKMASLADRAQAAMSWPNKPGDTTPPLKPLTEEQQKRFIAGRELFSQTCATCHQPSGLGQDGVAPPLVDSEWVLGPDARVARIVLNGLHGPVQVGKKTMDLEMPGLKTMDDEQLASILTYVRREWGHEGNPVEPGTLAKVRKETEARGDLQWTMEELISVK